MKKTLDSTGSKKSLKIKNKIRTKLSLRKTLQPQRRLDFNKNFTLLKQSMKINDKTRKLEFDSLLKRLKAKFFKTINECLKKCLKQELKIKRLSQKFITDIKISSNKKILNYSIEQIYSLNNINMSYYYLKSKENILEDKFQILKEFLSITFTEAYNMYYESNQYYKDCENIKYQESEKFFELFKYTSENFIKYYKHSKGNFMKKKFLKNSKHFFITIQT